MPDRHYTLGLDYGSNSVRCVVLDVATGEECGVSVWDYPSGEAGVFTDPDNPHVARQSPLDFVQALEAVVPEALRQAAGRPGFAPARVIGIGVDTTGSTPIPVTVDLTPLAALPEFAGNLNAMAWMWKDHSAMGEAERITALARTHRPQFLAKCGGAYSSEWFFSKIWHCLEVDPAVFEAAHTWLEFADFIPAVLAGIRDPEKVRRSICAAGHKAMYCDDWGGYPDAEFLARLDPRMGALRARLSHRAWPASVAAGRLCAEFADKLGLPEGIVVAVGAFDAHLGGVGAGIAEGRMVKILGTSTCDILVARDDADLPDIPGVCGIVKGSVLPGYYGIEAGQSAVGDIFNWFVTEVCEGEPNLHAELTDRAARLKPGESGLLALDWNNGNRTILVDARLSGLLVGCTLHTDRADIYRALIEATAFGARRILDRIEEYGVPVREVINCGGIAEKNPLFMQIYADVLGRRMTVSASSQTCALGAGIMAAVAAGPAAGGYATTEEAQQAICTYREEAYEPIPENRRVYDELYALYGELHDSFGVAQVCFDHYSVMKKLLDLSRRVRTRDV
ncbi:MAG: ribulokinase [Kiritimatiellaeota bacterium]|nr:ribulokinase [Kiritimatiellota bacterium]